MITEEKELTKDDLIAYGIDSHSQKRYYAKQISESAKLCSEELGIDKKSLIKVKDYIYYKGNGWGANCLEKSEEKEKYPDKVAPTFRKLLEIVTSSYNVGKKDILNDYIDALAKRGITITIDENMFIEPDAESAEKIGYYLGAMENFQGALCKENDYMTDVLAEKAEKLDLVNKSKYKEIIGLAVKKLEGKNISDKVQSEYEKTGLFINGLAKVSEMDITMPEPEI